MSLTYDNNDYLQYLSVAKIGNTEYDNITSSKVWMWGDNAYGQLGKDWYRGYRNITSTTNFPVSAAYSPNYPMYAHLNQIYVWDNYYDYTIKSYISYDTPTSIRYGQEFVAGGNCYYVKNNDGYWEGIGSNYEGQLGMDSSVERINIWQDIGVYQNALLFASPTTPVVFMVVDWESTIGDITTIQYTIYGTGVNDRYQLGLGTSSPVEYGWRYIKEVYATYNHTYEERPTIKIIPGYYGSDDSASHCSVLMYGSHNDRHIEIAGHYNTNWQTSAFTPTTYQTFTEIFTEYDENWVDVNLSADNSCITLVSQNQVTAGHKLFTGGRGPVDAYSLGRGSSPSGELSQVDIPEFSTWTINQTGGYHLIATATNTNNMHMFGWSPAIPGTINGPSNIEQVHTPRLFQLPAGASNIEQIIAYSAGALLIRTTTPQSYVVGSYPAIGIGFMEDTANIANPVALNSESDWVSMAKAFSNSTYVETNVGIKSDGSLWAWGDVSTNGIFNPTKQTTNSWIPQKLFDGNFRTVSIDSNGRIAKAIAADGSLWAWGETPFTRGKLGYNTAISSDTITRLGTDNDWTEVYTAVSTTYALKNNGTIWTAGTTANGGKTSSSVINYYQIGTDTDWVSIMPVHTGYGTDGYDHVIYGIKSNGTLWGWGNNSWGALAQGDRISVDNPVQIGTDTDWKVVLASGLSSAYWLQKQDGTIWNIRVTNPAFPLANPPIAQLGTESWVEINRHDNNLVARKADGTIWRLSGGTFTQIGTDSNWKGLHSTGGYKLDDNIWY